MTDRQRKRFYWPAWRRAAGANWRVEGGRAVAVAGRRETDTVREVEAVANWGSEGGRPTADSSLLTAENRLTLDRLRYAVHALAWRHCLAFRTGRDEAEIELPGEAISSEALGNDELEQAVAIMGLLAAPDDLTAVMVFVDPAAGARKRLEWAVKQCNEGYVRRVCGDRFGRGNWHELDDRELRQLVVTLRNRKGSRKPTAESAENAEGEEGEPF